MDTKTRRIYGKGAPFEGAPQRFGGKLPQTAPSLDPPLPGALFQYSKLRFNLDSIWPTILSSLGEDPD